MDTLSYIFALFPFGMCGLPALLALAALIDAVRTGADWYWVPIVLFLPVIGPVAYFVVTRTSLGGGVSAASADRAQRQWARRRLQELEIQLGHWRGPALLVEAGEALLLLGRVGEAERHLREAAANGASVETANYPLATALQYQGRYGEALPLFEALCGHDPEFKFGEAALGLARCLDESGDRDRAEQQLRTILDRHNFIEARVRLARILIARGDREEATRQLDLVRSDAASLPRKLVRHQQPWIRTAGRLRTGTATLPKPGQRQWGGGSRKWVIAAAVVAGLVPLAMLGYFVFSLVALNPFGGGIESYTRSEELANELFELDELHPPTYQTLPDEVELSADEVALYLRVRRALTPHVAVFNEARLAANQTTGAVDEDSALPMMAVHRSVKAMQRYTEVQVVFREAAVEVLRSERLGPGRLGQLLGVVEWRWLRRPDALIYALPPHDRELLWNTRAELGYYQDDEIAFDDEVYGRRWKVTRERLEARIADLEEKARLTTGVAVVSLELLETHRAELESFDPSELDPLLFVTDAILVVDE